MSTILQALEKSKFDRVAGSPPAKQPPSKLLQWKVAISLALFTIIVLLSLIVYLLLNTQSRIQPPVVTATQLSQPSTTNQVIKANFDTQPIPIAAPKPKQIIASVKKDKIHKKPVVEKAKGDKTVQIEPIEKNKTTEQRVEYDDVSEDLKNRFALALLMTDMENNEPSIEEIEKQVKMDDGSDIRDMNSEFQRKVAPIHYDSHMYSSKLEDRWIRINGEVLTEGEFDSTGQLELIEIQPQRSIFRLQRQSFSLESLTDWRGY